jgi:hypothetical protein
MSDDETNIDVYGASSPFDRLQFGYLPANADEAIAFHKRTSAAAWVAQRKEGYTAHVVKKTRKQPPHFESLSAYFKLRNHWKAASAFQQKGAGAGNVSAAEEFLQQLGLVEDSLPEPTTPKAGAVDAAPADESKAKKRRKKESAE